MTTSQRESCLTGESMGRLAQGKFPTVELAQLEDHIGSCERCRNMLASASLDSQWNDEVLPVLRTPSEGNGVFDDSNEGGHGEQSLESLLKLLGPIDDPHKLGRIGTYEVVGIIGRGGMGVVFKAFDAALNRFVAIKMLLPHLAVSGAARRRFAREGQAAAAVIDDNVLPIYSVAEWQGVPYLVSQYSRGKTLQKRIQDQGPLELKEILRIGMQTASGLAAAHAQGLVHRDVKPSNIVLDGTVERAMLTDFGLARAVDDASITRTGIIAGTPQYMSPEQARGGSVDARSDLFGLGCVLYAMCTGRPPFRAENSYAILRMITDDEPRSIREINPDIPEWLCLLISRLMAKSPDARFVNASEVAALLEQCLAHVQQPNTVDLPEQLRVSKHSTKARRTTAWTWIATTVAIVAFGLLGVVISLRMNEGTIFIESSIDDVSIQVTQGDKVIRELTVTKAGQQIRVAAGTYTIALEGEADGITVENCNVSLSRGGREVVKLTYQQRASSTMPPKVNAANETDFRVSNIHTEEHLLKFTLTQIGPQIADAYLEIQFHCGRAAVLPERGAQSLDEVYIAPSNRAGWTDQPHDRWVSLPLAPKGQVIALVFPDKATAVAAARQLLNTAGHGLLEAQAKANSLFVDPRNDGIIHGEHPLIGLFRTEFRVVSSANRDSAQLRTLMPSSATVADAKAGDAANARSTRLLDVLKLDMETERARFPLLDRVIDDIRLMEGGGLEILEKPVREDREQYAKDHPDLAKAFEGWQNDYRYVLRSTEVIPELFEDKETRDVMVTVAKLLIQSEDIPEAPKEQLVEACRQMGENPSDELVTKVFLELLNNGLPELRRRLRESGENVPHTGTHEDHLRVSERLRTYNDFARLYCAIDQSEMFRQIRKLQESADPATAFLFADTHPLPNNKKLSFLSRRGHEEVLHGQRAYHALPKDSVIVKWKAGDQEARLTNPDSLFITHVIIDRQADGKVVWNCYGIPADNSSVVPATWYRRDPFPQLGNHGATKNCLCRMEMELASYEPAQRELALTPEQQQQIRNINVAAIPFNANGGLTQQSTDADDRIIQILRPEQRSRLEQLLLQRLGLYAFEMDSIREALEVSVEQKRQIQVSWNDHVRRVQDLDVALNDHNIAAIQAGKSDASQLQASVAEHQQQKFASEARVWKEVYLILDAAQRQRFETLRGAQVRTTEIERVDAQNTPIDSAEDPATGVPTDNATPGK